MAQEPSDRTPRPSIRVTGETTIKAKPDQAQIDIDVITQAQNAQNAAAQNAQRLDALLIELRQALGSGAEIKTVGYSLSPNYRYPKEGGSPTLTGYTAANMVEVTIRFAKGDCLLQLAGECAHRRVFEAIPFQGSLVY